VSIQIDRYIADEEIEACATRILQKYGCQRTPIMAPPIPIEEIIDFTVDIPIIPEAIPDHQGSPVLAKLVVKGHPYPTVEIIVNENKQPFFDQHEGVERYSLAHELGHYVLHIDRGCLNTLLLPEGKEQSVVLCRMNSIEERDRNAKRREWQAERFAAFILMPRDLLREACTGMDLCQWRNLYRLKNEFHVTITALTNRLKELHLITVTLDGRLVPYQDKHTTQMRSLWE
jgi:IrrE N-terminal-like domain